MREYGQVQCHFWQSPEALSLSDQGKLLALYLLTGPHSNGIGCYRLPDGYVMADFGWSQETVSKGFEELFQAGFAKRFEGVVLIPNFLRWNGISNPNVANARQKEFEMLPKGEAKTLAARALLRFGKHWTEEFVTVLETLSKGLGKQEPTLPNPNLPKPKEGGKAAAPVETPPNLNEDAWSDYLKHRKELKVKKLTPKGELMAMRQLAELPRDEQQAVVDLTIQNGWTGLFPDKGRKGSTDTDDYYANLRRATNAGD